MLGRISLPIGSCIKRELTKDRSMRSLNRLRRDLFLSRSPFENGLVVPDAEAIAPIPSVLNKPLNGLGSTSKEPGLLDCKAVAKGSVELASTGVVSLGCVAFAPCALDVHSVWVEVFLLQSADSKEVNTTVCALARFARNAGQISKLNPRTKLKR